MRGIKIIFHPYMGVRANRRVLLPARVKGWVSVNGHLCEWFGPDKAAFERTGPFGVCLVASRALGSTRKINICTITSRYRHDTQRRGDPFETAIIRKRKRPFGRQPGARCAG